VNPLFADTFYFLALLHEDDAHAQALALSRTRSNPILTTVWVLTEVADALSAPNLRTNFLPLLEALRTDPACTIVPPTQELFDQGVEVYAGRADKEWSLTDCISFEVMRRYGVSEALTGDRHFEQAGFAALLK
jgi:uncharacterized protein